jgi:hypothetical protein
MSRHRPRSLPLVRLSDYDLDTWARPVVPIVDMPDRPRVRIYDPANDGTYWARDIRFTSKITDP